MLDNCSGSRAATSRRARTGRSLLSFGSTLQYLVSVLELLLPETIERVIVCLEPMKMRWGADRLRRFCREELEIEPDAATCFVFVNKARDMLLMYLVDEDGDQTMVKKLDKGAFLLPAPDENARFVEMASSMLPRLFRS